MAISFNTGATATANTAASVAITIPSGVLTNDVMVMMLAVFTEDSTAPTISFSGAGGTWTKLTTTDSSANPQVAQNGTVYSYGYAYWRVATSGDPGASLTITESGSAAGTTWFAVALTSYTGVNTSTPIDVAGGATGGTTDVVTCPAETTTVANDWGLYLGGGGANGTGATMPGPTAGTSRENISSTAGIGAAVFDSNGSVGGSGTSIGGTSAYQYLTSNHPNTGFLTGFTIALQPPSGATGPAGSVQPRATVPVPRRTRARGLWHGSAPFGGFVAVPAPRQEYQLLPRRYPARAYVRFTPVTTTNHVSGQVQPRATVPVPRRAAARGQWHGSAPFGGFAAVAAPRQLPRLLPRRSSARAVVYFTPVTTANQVSALGPAGQVPAMMVNRTEVISRVTGRVVRR